MGVILALLALLAAAHAAAAPTETFAIAAAPQTLAVGALSGYQPVRLSSLSSFLLHVLLRSVPTRITPTRLSSPLEH